MKFSKYYRNVLPALAIAIAAGSCNKALDVEPEDTLSEKNVYNDVFDADAAVVGVYGKFMALAESHILFNELRADLMTTTPNSTEYLRQLSEHDIKDGNPLVSPRPYYEVIMNCNDVLYHFAEMFRDKKLSTEEYNMRSSDIATLRSWVYLQLGIQFGSVPYVTDRLANVTDISNVLLMPKIDFNTLLGELIKTMEAIPYPNQYPAGTSLVTSTDGFNTAKFFIPKKVVMGELYLWKGEYRKAASVFKDVMETAGAGAEIQQVYKVAGVSKGDNNDLAVGYYRYREMDENMLVNNNSQGWRSIFARSDDNLFNREHIWVLPFSNSVKPGDPFINLFSTTGGKYLVKPSQEAISGWNSQKQKNDFPYDARGKKFTYNESNGNPVITKYLYSYLDPATMIATNPFNKISKWFLYRAASLHLHYAEAANRDSKHYVAYALVNNGIISIPGANTNLSYPYNLDARRTETPSYIGNWFYNAGVRGRAYLYPKPLGTTDSTIGVENMIIDEAALELAYEGRRWADLVRVALRRNDPSFLADKIYNKLQKENNPAAAAVRAKLMNKENWYLPFK